jgi:hypothetical protein
MKFTLSLNVGGTVEDYRDIAAVLRNVADELDEPDDGWAISPTGPAPIYTDAMGIRNPATIGRWQVTAGEQDAQGS